MRVKKRINHTKRLRSRVTTSIHLLPLPSFVPCPCSLLLVPIVPCPLSAVPVQLLTLQCVGPPNLLLDVQIGPRHGGLEHICFGKWEEQTNRTPTFPLFSTPPPQISVDFHCLTPWAPRGRGGFKNIIIIRLYTLSFFLSLSIHVLC